MQYNLNYQEHFINHHDSTLYKNMVIQPHPPLHNKLTIVITLLIIIEYFKYSLLYRLLIFRLIYN